jgi:acyl carrier protein
VGGTSVSYPTLDETINDLKDLLEIDDLDADVPISELGEIDSLDLMEWVYRIQEQYSISIDESVFDDIDETSTLRQLYELVMKGATAATVQA